jgi:hypothetical protein
MDELVKSLKSEEKTMSEIAVIAAAMFVKSIKYTAVFALPVYFFINLVSGIAVRQSDIDLFEIITDGPALSDIGALRNLAFMSAAVNALFAPIAAAAATGAVANYLEKALPTVSALSERSVFIWWKLAPTAALYWLFFYIGVPFIVPALYFGVIFMFYIQAVVFCGNWGFGALRISRGLVRGRFFKTLFRFAALLAAHGIFAFIVMIVTAFLPYNENLIFTAFYAALRQTAGLFFVYFTAVWFYNRLHNLGRSENE